jgi:mono/diheme cytochrome c family protein
LAAQLRWMVSAALGAALITAPTIGHAQVPMVDIGKVEYRNSCAGCHGFDGKGNELVAAQLNKSMPDLTALQKNNRGTLPLSRLYNVIDGREAAATYGPRDMPVWGSAFGMRVDESSGDAATVRERESYTWRRIFALIGYISTMQSK